MFCMMMMSNVSAFVSHATRGGLCGTGSSQFIGRKMQIGGMPQRNSNRRKKTTELKMLLGSDAGVFGVGAPEIAVVLVVGYFILGPTELYSLVKEVGKFVQNIRTLGADASTAFQDSMENQLELQELRDAQKELNDAFSFRRSINVDDTAEAFATTPKFDDASAVAETTAAAAATTTRKKRRRIKKKKKQPVEEDPPPMGTIPDLDMSDAFSSVMDDDTVKMETEEEGRRRLREERIARLSTDSTVSSDSSDLASQVLSQQEQDAASSRFAAQLGGSWNDQILDNEDKLSPLSTVMEKLALLEEEQMSAVRRLEEEFAKRAELDEFYYREKRSVLEEAAAKIQADAYAFPKTTDNDNLDKSTNNSNEESENATKTQL